MSLTSHEDLTPYIEQLKRISSMTAAEMERRRSFAADSETLIKELLTEVMYSRKSIQQCSNIAMKFLEAYQTGIEDLNRSAAYNSTLQEDIGDLNLKIQKLQKEIEIKDSRYESIALEATDIERALKSMNAECSQLKKEKDLLKKQIEQKEQSLINRETTIHQRQKMYIEVEKEKESDKGLIIQIERLNIDLRRKQNEVEELNKRLNEVENLYHAERANSEKLKGVNQQLRSDNSICKLEIENWMQKNVLNKEKIKQLKEEVVQEKAYNESLVKEYDRQRISVQMRRESVEINEDLVGNLVEKLNKPESLGDLMQEFEDSIKGKNEFDDSAPTEETSPRFMLFQTKKICSQDSIFITPVKTLQILPTTPTIIAKASLQIDVRDALSVPSKPPSSIPAILASKYHNKVCLSSSLSISRPRCSLKLHTEKIFNYKRLLNIDRSEGICIFKVLPFNFDDAASVNSNETEASNRARKTSVVEIRDPIKEFFIFTCQAAKLNSVHKDKVGNVPVNTLYENVLQQGVPFNLWHDYITEYLHARLKKRNKL